MGHKSGRALSTTASFCSSFVIISCQAARIGYLAAPAASIRPRDPCCTMRSVRRAWLKTLEQQTSFQNDTSSLHYFISVNGLLPLFSKPCSCGKKHEVVTVGNKIIISHVIALEPNAYSRDYSPLFFTWLVSFHRNASVIK